MGTMTSTVDFRRTATAACAVVPLLLLAACSSDPAVTDIERRDLGDNEIASYADVEPDISPRGYAALGCSVHTALADVNPGDLISRRDPSQAGYQASSALLIAAGVWDSAAYGALVEPASQLPLVHAQGEWDTVAEARNSLSRLCGEISRSPVGAHVFAAYACHIADRVAETAPTHRDVPRARLAPTEDEISALTHLARAAAVEEPYQRLERRTERLHLTRTDEAIVGEYADRMAAVRTLCAQYG
jgi:hypothetical protein